MDRGSWHCTGGSDQDHPKKKKCKKTKRLSEEAFQIAEKGREANGQGKKERYTNLNAEFQRTERRDKKAKTFDCMDHKKLWKILEDMGIPATLRASWETSLQVKKQQLEPDMVQQTGSKLGKGYVKAVYCHPAYLTSMNSTSCKLPGWMKHKLEPKLLGEISITSDTQMTPPLWHKAKRNKRASWWRWKRRVKKLA